MRGYHANRGYRRTKVIQYARSHVNDSITPKACALRVLFSLSPPATLSFLPIKNSDADVQKTFPPQNDETTDEYHDSKGRMCQNQGTRNQK